MKFKLLACLFLLAVTPVFAEETNGLKDTVVLVIRHAEKPDKGNELTPAGEERAKAYIHYFKNFTVDAKPVTVNYLFAAADSDGSHRPRLTLEPFSKAMGMTIDQRFAAKQGQGLANELRAKPHGGCVLICWHHGQIPELLQALGADPNKLLPGGKWPDNTFGWVIQLRYDDQGQLVKATRINEKLMPDDEETLKDMRDGDGGVP
jgi:hypothetical protein